MNPTNLQKPAPVETKPGNTNPYADIKVMSKPPLTSSNKPTYEEDGDSLEEVVYKNRGKGCSVPGCSCRSIACGGCFLIVLAIIGIVFIVINKPSGIWGNVVNFLNAGVVIPSYNNETADTAKNDINEQIKNVGDNVVTLDESALTAIVRQKIPDLKNPVVDIEPDFIRIYWDLDETMKGNPLYGVIEIKVVDKDLKITKVGVARVGTPAILNDFVSNTILSLVKGQTAEAGKDYGLLYTFLAPDKNVSITDLKLEKDKAEITINISASLF